MYDLSPSSDFGSFGALSVMPASRPYCGNTGGESPTATVAASACLRTGMEKIGAVVTSWSACCPEPEPEFKRSR